MMGLFPNGLPSDPVTLLLLDTLAQVTAITLLALVVMRTVARRSPAARHGIALCALFCVLSSPAIAGSVERVGHSEASVHLWNAPPPHVISAFEQRSVGYRQNGATLHPVTGALLVIWGVGVGWQIVRFGAGCVWLVRLRRNARSLDLKDRPSVLVEVSRAIGRRRLPVLCESLLVRGPVVLGPFRPMIVMPAGMAHALEDSALRDILLHECAHLVQNHHVLGCAQRCVATLFWPHPLVHALCRELGQSAEELCDNFVLRHSEAPQYARTLLTVATSAKSEASPVQPIIAPVTPSQRRAWTAIRWRSQPQPGRLVARVEGLLDRRRERRTQWDLWKQVVLTSLFLALATSVSAMRVSQAAARPARSVGVETRGPGFRGPKIHGQKPTIEPALPQSTSVATGRRELHR